MDLRTTYLGLDLRSPLVVSASPLSEEIDSVRRMEDAGAAAIVHRQIAHRQAAICPHLRRIPIVSSFPVQGPQLHTGCHGPHEE